jgi:hypothetical protein
VTGERGGVLGRAPEPLQLPRVDVHLPEAPQVGCEVGDHVMVRASGSRVTDVTGMGCLLVGGSVQSSSSSASSRSIRERQISS